MKNCECDPIVTLLDLDKSEAVGGFSGFRAFWNVSLASILFSFSGVGKRGKEGGSPPPVSAGGKRLTQFCYLSTVSGVFTMRPESARLGPEPV